MSTKVQSWLVQIAIAIGIFLVIFFTRPKLDWIAANDSFFVVSAIFFSWVALKWISDKGTFDLTSYSLIKFGDSLRKDSRRSFKDPYEYQNFKESNRVKSKKTYVSYLFIAFIFTLFTIITYFFI